MKRQLIVVVSFGVIALLSLREDSPPAVENPEPAPVQTRRAPEIVLATSVIEVRVLRANLKPAANVLIEGNTNEGADYEPFDTFTDETGLTSVYACCRVPAFSDHQLAISSSANFRAGCSTEFLSAGEPGEAVSFVNARNEAHFKLIEKRHKIKIARERIAGFEPKDFTPPREPNGVSSSRRRKRR